MHELNNHYSIVLAYVSDLNKIPFLDLHSQYLEIKTSIDEAISRTINDSTYILGEKVQNFENEFANWNGSKYCIGCANGTDAIEIALEALGVGTGDDVIVPAMTWISTAEAVLRVGANPIFVDIDKNSYCLDCSKVEEYISKKTKAIIAVHLYGYPADVITLREICNNYNIFLIEDCAQAHGALIKEDKKVGTIGDMGTFSFFPGKNLGAYGDAGCIVTNNSQLATICREIGNHGQIKKHHHNRIGRNSRLDGLQAAILSAKLPFLNKWIAHRQEIATKYMELLGYCGVKLPYCPHLNHHAFHLFVVLSDSRDELSKYLLGKGISTGIHYPQALTQMAVFKDYANQHNSHCDYVVAESIAANAISLPISDQLSVKQVEFISFCVNEFLDTRH